MKCTYCVDFFQLCPPQKNLLANLNNHLGGTKQEKAVQDADNGEGSITIGKRGRPSRSIGASELSNQRDLHSWFRHTTYNNEVGDFQCMDMFVFLPFMCWGFRGPNNAYAGKSYIIEFMLNDPHLVKHGLRNHTCKLVLLLMGIA